jgi:hypothetical protein
MPPKGKNPGNSSSGRSPGRGGGKGGARKAPPPITMKKPKPWGLIAATMVVALFAAGVLGYAIYRVNQSSQNTPEAKAEAAKSIQGITVVDYPGGVHKDTAIAYDQSPPFGGEHNNTWADCMGTVYPAQIASENAVHSLEHGAIWITHRPDLPADQLDVLKKKVDGVEYMLLSPYAGLKTPVSVQSWGHQLFLDSANDPRLDQFIDDLRLNAVTTPEFGAPCSNPAYKASPQAPFPAAGTPAPSAPAPTPTQG